MGFSLVPLGLGRGFFETAETRLRMMVTCQQKTKGKDRRGRLDFKGSPPLCVQPPSLWLQA